MDIAKMIDDKREINSIEWDDIDGTAYTVDGHRVTAIKVYDEPGVGGMMPCLAVYQNDMIIARVPAWKVSIHYKK